MAGAEVLKVNRGEHAQHAQVMVLFTCNLVCGIPMKQMTHGAGEDLLWLLLLLYYYYTVFFPEQSLLLLLLLLWWVCKWWPSTSSWMSANIH